MTGRKNGAEEKLSRCHAQEKSVSPRSVKGTKKRVYAVRKGVIGTKGRDKNKRLQPPNRGRTIIECRESNQKLRAYGVKGQSGRKDGKKKRATTSSGDILEEESCTNPVSLENAPE